MNHIKHLILLLAIASAFTLSGCGKSEPEKTASKPAETAAAPKYNDNLDHRAFEAKSADVCVKKELALRKKEHPTSGNAGVADDALTKLCACIASEESKHLTKQEAKKFVEQNEYPMSLMIKAGQAEEICSKQ
jgi:hypothetical protein